MNHISNSDAAWIALAALLPMVLYLVQRLPDAAEDVRAQSRDRQVQFR
jgi:hypothetical protein